jgi:hypothetical protein
MLCFLTHPTVAAPCSLSAERPRDDRSAWTRRMCAQLLKLSDGTGSRDASVSEWSCLATGLMVSQNTAVPCLKSTQLRVLAHR